MEVVIEQDSAEVSEDNTPVVIYIAITIMTVGALSSGCAFIWEKFPMINSDESR